MLRLLTSNALFYFLPVTSLVPPAAVTFAKGKLAGFLSVMALFVPALLTGSVLWTEKEDSPAFLRALPITDREVVLSRFSLTFLATSVYWLILSSLVIHFGHFFLEGGEVPLGANLALVNLSCVFGLLLACGWHVAIWRFGTATVVPIMVLYLVLNLAASILFNVDLSSGKWAGAQGMLLVRWLVGFPWYLDLVLVLAAALALYGILQLAVWTRERSGFEVG